jgi:WD40 repeat protein
MVYLWSASTGQLSARVGYHTDYVKALAYSSGKGWVASGGLDRRIVLWDTGEGRGEITSFDGRSQCKIRFCFGFAPEC